MSGGEVSDQTGSVHGNIATLGTGEGDLLGQEGRDLVLEMDGKVVGAVLGGDGGGTDGTAVGGGKHLHPNTHS